MNRINPRRVLFVCERLPQYRLAFCAQLATVLNANHVDMTLVYGDAVKAIHQKSNDAGSLALGEFRRNRSIGVGDRRLVWQPCLDHARSVDLVVVEQKSRLLANYWLLLRQYHGGARVALWGHGRYLNQRRASRLGEAVKSITAKRPHWWFAYTEGTKNIVTSGGYPADRITVTQNAGDSSQLFNDLRRVSGPSARDINAELSLEDGPVGLFIGSLYPDKRIDFLGAVAAELESLEPSFRMVIAGEGPMREDVVNLTERQSNVRYAGRAVGIRKAALLKRASVLLLPGAVGLAVVDGFTAGVPTVTTAVCTHGPEVEYIDDGVNGVILRAQSEPAEYARAALGVAREGKALGVAARIAGQRITTEAMVTRFAEGIHQALLAPPIRQLA